MESKIRELKESSAVITYLEFLQNAIIKMGTNSGNTKALIAVVYTLFITVQITVAEIKCFWWLGILIALIGAVIDAYYLGLEKAYRKKYNDFLAQINEGELDIKAVYDMNPKSTELKCEMLAQTLHAIRSFSVWIYYVILVSITLCLRMI